MLKQVSFLGNRDFSFEIIEEQGMAKTKRAALYVRVSTDSQTVENQW
jgi:hypothetical protein